VPQVLLIEDDARLARVLTQGLLEESYQVDVARDGRLGLERMLTASFDLCILDVLLPTLDGFEVLKRAREQGVTTPVLMLTARDGIADRVRGLKLGADDYLIKPFAFAELMARLQVLLRRGKMAVDKLSAGEVTLDPGAHRVWRGEQEVELSHKQFMLLELLLRHRGQVVSRAMILKRLWGYDFEPGTNLVDVHIAHLRQKIDAPDKPSLIQSVRGGGYRLQGEPEADKQP